MPERLCPFGDGRHKRKPWTGGGYSWREPGVRSGFACVRCSKTWEYVGDNLVETYELLAKRNQVADLIPPGRG